MQVYTSVYSKIRATAIQTNYRLSGHREYWGNQEADKFAKLGAEAGEKTIDNLPQSYLKHQELHRQVIQRKLRLQDDNKVKLNRVDTKTAVQILSGHTAMNNPFYKYVYTESPGCSKF